MINKFHTVGNKVDRDDREIPPSVGEVFSRMNNMYFIETSAKDCSNVDKLFQEIARELIQVKLLHISCFLYNFESEFYIDLCCHKKTMRNQRQESVQARRPGLVASCCLVVIYLAFNLKFCVFIFQDAAYNDEPSNRQETTQLSGAEEKSWADTSCCKS